MLRIISGPRLWMARKLLRLKEAQDEPEILRIRKIPKTKEALEEPEN